jgi:NAD(P)-dependent dehydrogenase (short-subunit alcohol dehydrogenase family)
MGIPKRRVTKQGHEMQWAVNHLGHFYLTYLLWNKIQKSNFFRIINVSSLAHKRILGFL